MERGKEGEEERRESKRAREPERERALELLLATSQSVYYGEAGIEHRTDLNPGTLIRAQSVQVMLYLPCQAPTSQPFFLNFIILGESR